VVIYEIVANLFILGISLILVALGLVSLLGLLKAIYDTLKD
jgi:uncharacterized membrane protein YqjE